MPTDLRRLADNPQVALTPKGYEGIGALNWLAFNLTKKPLSDVQVRKAIATAIDKNFIAKALMGGFATVADGPIVASSPFAVTDLVRYPVDLKKAAEMLDAAGYKAGANGERFKLTIDYLPGADDQQKTVAEYLRGQLKKVGIAVEVRASADFPAWAKRMAIARLRHVDGPGLQLGRPDHRRAPHLPVDQHQADRLDQHAVLQQPEGGRAAQHRRRHDRPDQAQGLLRRPSRRS